ncbi:MAG: hypothetical protein KDJ47_00745 [Hyphomicrobiaceae bacterium]|nr:hypothetical protein [Hyphomicrobiaceae bacterium]
MPSMIVWGIAFATCLSMMMLTAGAKLPLVHLAMGVIIALGIAFAAILENQKLRREGAPKSVIASATARSMGFIYMWAAVVIALTYLTLFNWHEWWQWFLALALVGTMCIFYSNLLTRDAEAHQDDKTMIAIGNKLTWVQFIGMGIAIVGMLVDGKLTRYTNPQLKDWAAQNVFFTGAVGLMVLSAYVLWASRNDRVA